MPRTIYPVHVLADHEASVYVDALCTLLRIHLIVVHALDLVVLHSDSTALSLFET